MKFISIVRTSTAFLAIISSPTSSATERPTNNNTATSSVQAPIHVAPVITNNNHVSLFFSQEINNIITKIKEMGARAQEIAAVPFQKASDLYTWMCEHKIRTAFYCAVAGYTYLHYQLFTLKRELSDPNNWSLWNRIMPLEEIFAMQQKAVAETLVREVQRRYTSTETPDDFISPMTAFLRDVEQEQKLLKRYIALCSWLKTLYIAKICWFDEDVCAACNERLQRLAYIKSVFINWVTEYKFAQNAASAITPNFAFNEARSY